MQHDSLQTLAARYRVAETLSGVVLVVDDEAPNLVLLEDFLDGDYTVLTAHSGAEALELIESRDIDVVVSDHRMPGMTGVELLTEIHARRPDVAGILLTAFTDTPVLISAINQARVFRHMRKPWQPEEILEAVAAASRQVHQGRLNKKLLELLARRTEDLAGALEHLREAQQQMLHLERLGTMGKLTAGVTHDLRSLIQYLVQIEDALPMHRAPRELSDALRVGVAGMRNLMSSLGTINQYASDGALRMHFEEVHPAEVARDAEAVLKLDLNVRERSFEVVLHDPLPVLRADRQKLVQVVVNFVRNAVQATGVRQRVVLSVASEADGTVVFAVDDEGAGVPVAMRDRLFEPFATDRAEKGMGMGLYMARLIAESHRGVVRAAESALGGARFELRLKSPAQSTS